MHAVQAAANGYGSTHRSKSTFGSCPFAGFLQAVRLSEPSTPDQVPVLTVLSDLALITMACVLLLNFQFGSS